VIESLTGFQVVNDYKYVLTRRCALGDINLDSTGGNLIVGGQPGSAAFVNLGSPVKINTNYGVNFPKGASLAYDPSSKGLVFLSPTGKVVLNSADQSKLYNTAPDVLITISNTSVLVGDILIVRYTHTRGTSQNVGDGTDYLIVLVVTGHTFHHGATVEWGVIASIDPHSATLAAFPHHNINSGFLNRVNGTAVTALIFSLFCMIAIGILVYMLFFRRKEYSPLVPIGH